ncbi:7940_t:CDS:1 [Dentiscutata heterogama]|uniref:7940_t:CDS:1 n=1 Tax=Dentiscutata heterogama TaxID=1316150 RepID=A0ACA9KKA5_9GLOM|nr:7940_t:CDS:1 [Dentiscutata heterogama]
MHFKSSLGLNGLEVSSSVIKYQDGNKEVKFISGVVSVGVEIGDNIGKAGFEAKLDVINLEVNSLGLKTYLGVNTSTGVSFSSDNIETNLAGCGIKIGKVVGITTPIGGISLDIGNLIKTSMTILDRNVKTNIASGGIMDKMSGKEMNIGEQLFIIVETGALISNGDVLTSTKDGKEICINTLTGGELINIDNAIAEATCNNESFKTNITDLGIKVGEKIVANMNIGEKIVDNMNIGEKIVDNMNIGEKIVANMNIGGITLLSNIKDLINTSTSVECSNESIMTNIESCYTKVKKEISANTPIDGILNKIRNLIK